MRFVGPPGGDDEAWYDRIADSKHEPRKTHLYLAKGAVLQEYGSYLHHAPEVQLVGANPLTAVQSEALIHAYSGETYAMTSLRDWLMARADLSRCPFCSINEAGTLDHYLPKEQYPQFSIFPKNLIPCCDKCNRAKSEYVIDPASAARSFLNPYYDQLPDLPLLIARIAVQPPNIFINYSIDRPPGIRPSLCDHLNRHIRLLGLAERYQRMSLDELRGQYQALATCYGPRGDAQAVSAALTTQSVSLADTFGPNYWRAALYAGLAVSADFCDGGFQLIVT